MICTNTLTLLMLEGRARVEKGEAGERDCPLGLLCLMRAVKKVLYMWVINLGERAEQ